MVSFVRVTRSAAVAVVMVGVALFLLGTGLAVACVVHLAGVGDSAELALDAAAAAIVTWGVLYALLGVAVGRPRWPAVLLVLSLAPWLAVVFG